VRSSLFFLGSSFAFVRDNPEVAGGVGFDNATLDQSQERLGGPIGVFVIALLTGSPTTDFTT